MTEWWKGISPETLAVVGALMILREVFAFLKSRQIDSTAEKIGHHEELVVSTLKAINESLMALVQLVRETAFDIQELRRQVKSLREDVDLLRKEKP